MDRLQTNPPGPQINNSGAGSGSIAPPGVAGWSWAAFLLGPIWAVFNRVWIGLLTLIPIVGLIAYFYICIKGREIAWRNKQWESVEAFNRVQRHWALAALIATVVVMGLGFAVALMGAHGSLE